MDFYILISIFLIIVVVLFIFKKPLLYAMTTGIFFSIIFYQISFFQSIEVITKSITSSTTINVLLILYLITVLQRMMSKENALIKAQQQFELISNHRKINTFLMPMFIGLLPSASAIYLAGDMVKESVKDELDVKEQTFVASYYRHTFESFIPTYSSVIIAVSLTNTNLGLFIIAMLPMVLVYIFLGYAFYLRKLSNNSHRILNNKLHHLKQFLFYLSPIIIILILIMLFNIHPSIAALIVIILYSLFNRYTFEDIKFFIKDGFEIKVLLTILLIFVFKDIINYTQTLETLPNLMANINIPSYLLFGAIFFVGSLILGNSAVYAIMLPLAFLSVPNAGLALLVYLNSLGFIAMQISPTHICLFMAVEYFKVTLLDLIKKTIPIVIIFSIIATLYYLILINIT